MALITVDDLKHRLELVGDDGEVTTDAKQETFLASCVSQADSVVKSAIGRDIEEQSWTEYAHGNGSCYLELRHGPLVSLTTVDLVARTQTGDSETSQDADLIVLHGRRDVGWKQPGALFREVPAWQWGQFNYKVVYVAGYATIPEDIKHAALLIAVAIRNKRKDAATMMRDLGTGSGRSFRSEDNLIEEVLSVVHAYRDTRV